MDTRRPSSLDEADGMSAVGAIFVGDLEGAVDALEKASARYLAGFLWRLGLLMPSVSFRLVWRFARRRLRSSVRS